MFEIGDTVRRKADAPKTASWEKIRGRGPKFEVVSLGKTMMNLKGIEGSFKIAYFELVEKRLNIKDYL